MMIHFSLLAGSMENGAPWFSSACAHLAFGVGLFYTIKKFFEEVEKPLHNDVKLEIAVWLLDIRPSKDHF
jgi:hypothetical protein